MPALIIASISTSAWRKCTFSSIIPCILEQNDFEEVYSDTCWQKMKQGTGVWGVYWDQEKLGGLGDISIRPVNVLNLVWEPGVTDIQKSQNVFYLELEDNETLLAAYPQLAGKLGGSSGLLARYRTDDAVDLSEKTLVVDWYYKKRVGGKTLLHYCRFCGDEVLYASENDTQPPVMQMPQADGTVLDVKVNGALFAKAEVVVMNGNYGLRVLELCGASLDALTA